jgi:hypothetical protein
LRKQPSSSRYWNFSGSYARLRSSGIGRWRRDKLIRMSDLIDDAVRVLRSLPADAQEAAARAIIDYSAGEHEAEA